MNPSLLLIPDRYKASKLYSQIPDTGAGDLAFTRALDTATRVGIDGLIEKVRRNLVLNSAVFVTQTISVGANPHTLSFTGTGTIVITGVGSGTLVGTGASNRVSLSFTTTAGSLILTLTGTATLAQLETGDIATPYIPTTTTAVSVGMLADIPRIDYTGGGCGKLLLEPQRANLVTTSDLLQGAAVWTYSSNMTTTKVSATNPTGYNNALSMVATATNANHRAGIVNYAGGGIYILGDVICATAFVKANGYNFVKFGGFFNNESAWYNLSTGAVASQEASVLSAKIENYGNSWYRITNVYTFGNTIANGNLYFQLTPAPTANTTYTGNGTSGCFAFGGQVEKNVSYPTSYIPTLGAAVTRSADVASKTGISALIGQTEGTLFVDFEFEGYDNLAKWIAFLRNAASSHYVGFYTNTISKLGVEVSVDAVDQFSNFSFTLAVGQRYKAAVAYKANDFAFYINGAQIATDNSGLAPVTSEFTLQFNANNNNLTARTYNQALLFKTRLTNAELATLTSL